MDRKYGVRVVIVASRMDSMGDNESGSYYGFRNAKAVLNAAAVSVASELDF